MSRVLPAVLALLLSGCGKGQADPAEIVMVFDRHSYAECDLARLEESLRASGAAALSSFDPYALFFPPGERPQSGSFGGGKAGAGLVLWRGGAAAVAVRVFPGSPAEAEGIRAGDVISSLDGQTVADLADPELAAALYGSAGGAFRVKGEKRLGGAINSTLKRSLGGMPTVWGFNIPGSRAGYLRIVNFSRNTTPRLKAEMNDLLDRGAARIIIDLRGNYGGSLEELSSSLALFAPCAGPVFRAVSRHAGYSKVFSAGGPGPYAGLKPVILVDGKTISRAEIFAAALREWGGASIVGGVTAGSVSATRGFRLKGGAALRLTVARLLTPAGLDLEGKGLAPDIILGPTDGPGAADKEGGVFREFPAALASSDPVLLKVFKVP
ncbi:MAG: hypothetical protein A2234_11340 [Elusimicrobia bacterium RIFOXYA2_FULL_58_8]|nr:MAG: hypothetical protein A2285_00715 [Elusimicrobia bacterium RIFOXYA12_FULL_57_11]OGS14491.1 MAG: hypothetical protein A2234_11340 [Elusimicrobia bacterium RIFOXYA2_FULL_58_8]